MRTHLVVLLFTSQTLQAVKNKLFVQFVVSVGEKPPNCFSFHLEILPRAQSFLEVEKQN